MTTIMNAGSNRNFASVIPESNGKIGTAPLKPTHEKNVVSRKVKPKVASRRCKRSSN